jgi:hypothetical protein
MAEEIVLKRYATELGSKGQCQKWKIKAIANDRRDGRLDTSVLQLLMEDIEKEVEQLLAVKPIVQELCKKSCEPPAVIEKKPAEPEPKKACEPPAVIEKKPAEPTQSLPGNPHGIDLDWN